MSETPESVILGFAERLSQGDLEGALELYEPDAALKPTLTGEIQGVREGRDVALVLNR